VYEALGFGASVLRHDLTELAGLDDLANPQACIAEGEARTAETLGVQASFYSVQGSTVGLQAAMLAAFPPGSKVVLPRTAHRSVLAACILGDLTPVWLLPTFEPSLGLWLPPTIEQVETAFAHTPDAVGVVLNNPTYEGLAAPLLSISQLCHRLNKTLIVDEAHGALFPYHVGLPLSATELPQAGHRVDAVVQSIHKTGGSLTQTAVLHVPKSSCLNPTKVAQCLRTLHTTSPNVLLLASLDATLAWLGSQEAHERLSQAIEHATLLKQSLAITALQLKPLLASHCPQYQLDPLRLYLFDAHACASNASRWIAFLEEEQGVPYEATTGTGALYLLHWAQPTAFYGELAQRIHATEAWLTGQTTEANSTTLASFAWRLPNAVLSPREAFYAEAEAVRPEKAVGRVSQQTVVRCPPGIPELLPGERIYPHHLACLPNPVWVVA
jgi:arginine decarboxylase